MKGGFPNDVDSSLSARLIAVLGAIVGALGTANAALAAESCVYDPATRTVTASITANGQATLVGDGGTPNQLRFGQVPAACGGATTTNTDTIDIPGWPGGIEKIVLDERSGVFAPSATAEFSMSEIEFDLDMGDATDRIIVWGTKGDDEIAAGQSGPALNSDGDNDIVVAPGAFILEVHLLGGNDFFNGRGTFGAELRFLGPITATAGPATSSSAAAPSPTTSTVRTGNDTSRATTAST